METIRVKFMEKLPLSSPPLSLSHPHILKRYFHLAHLALCCYEQRDSHSPPLMALTIANSGSSTGGARVLYSSSTTSRQYPYTNLSSQRHLLFPPSSRRALYVVSAKRFASRTGRTDGRNRKSTSTTRDQEQDMMGSQRTAEIENVGGGVVGNVDDRYFLPKLPGDEPCFWEGEKWDWLGFFVEYLWAFGIGFALIACLVAATSYNEGATDFKETPVYKDSFQSREFLEEPEASNPDVFESNPTEVAPSLE
ncbi:hypothetical protein ACFX13_016099 [Malus domestica]|uniref:Uncharacterized protein n=2 Tax=Malus TaxID=3749 RepID=A0A498I8A2_MALDO|nr:hypothetical protein DVH24_023587 [Malus domestica]